MEAPKLSILVVTHNQLGLLQRCLDSLIAQELEIPFEIIVSDDRSSDGTDLFVNRLKQYYEGVKTNLTQIKYVRCNSDECNPTNTSERCGWNKLNAYLHSKGEYFVNVDADDYLRSNDIFQRQIETLEAHPECSMCMQKALSVENGASIDKGVSWPQSPRLMDGAILSAETIIREGLRGLNQTYMIRRRPQDDMMNLYGKWFDDTIITYHHLQFAPVVFIDRTDYVWVQYKDSISHKMSKDDAAILYGLLPLFHAELVPALKTLFIQSGIPIINHLLKTAPEFPALTLQYRLYLKQFKGFIYRYYLSVRHGFYDYTRFAVSRSLLRLANRFKWESSFICNMIVRVLI